MAGMHVTLLESLVKCTDFILFGYLPSIFIIRHDMNRMAALQGQIVKVYDL